MAAGTLSLDQLRFVTAMTGPSGLDRLVVTAWIGAESGWDVTKASHNYLNVRDPSTGQFRTYASADQAGAAAASLLTGSHHYTGVVAAIPAGPVATVEAIQASPWDAAHYDGHRLLDTLKSVVGAGGTTTSAELTSVEGDLKKFGGHMDGGGPSGVAGGVLSDAAKAVVESLLPVGLTIVFTAAALGLIGIGVYTLAGSTSAGKAAIDATQKVGSVAAVAAA